MSKRNRYRLFAGILATAMLAAALAGCGGKTGGTQGAEQPAASQSAAAAPADTPGIPAKPETETASTPAAPKAETIPVILPAAEKAGAAPRMSEDGTIHVRSVQELVEAIHPLANIVVEPGRYNLTEFLTNYPNPRDYDEWNEAHPYVQIEDAYDGLELVVRGVAGLRIEGGSDDPMATEIVTEPRYATVLSFTDCTGVELACLSMGHTDGGDCSGNVLDFNNCQNIRLRTMDLYGCGANGISAMDGTGDMQVSNSTIRDCTYGPFEFFNVKGEFRFTACVLSGSDGGGYYAPSKGSSLTFVGCAFGEKETNRWLFDDNATFENCVWSQVTQYPDIAYPDVDPGMAD